MRLYHFTTAHYALDNVDRRRLKIAQIPDLNDPFELLCCDLSDKDLRESMHKWKAHMGGKYGILCFSKDWKNPVQWSHYSDRHRGVCLGFDIKDDTIIPVVYDEMRSAKDALDLLKAKVSTTDHIKKFVSTKFKHWEYEQECRVFVDLKDKDPVTGLFFCNFSDSMKLAEVIIGADSKVQRKQVAEVLRDLESSVTVTNARLAFTGYDVVVQQNKKLWK